MAAELKSMAKAAQQNPNPKKRKMKQGKGKKKPNKKLKPASRPQNPSLKMRKLFEKRVKAYNSDDEDEDEAEAENQPVSEEDPMSEDEEEEERRDLEVEREVRASDDEEDDDGGGERGITKFTEGCRVFKVAFLNIMKKKLPNDPLGPILSLHKKLVAEKLAEEETEHKAKGEAKKEKHLAGEKGHVKPVSFLDAKEKTLISIATKGVVKLFNAVNKAQNPQRGLNPSKSKDAKELAKKRKQTFFSELTKSTVEAPGGTSHFNSSKANKLVNEGNNDEPGWAPLRDSYMLTNPKLKDWDKMPEDPSTAIVQGKMLPDSSSDED